MAVGKYETHIEPKLLLIEAWSRDGMIEKDIALKLGVAYSTFRKYRDAFPALAAAVKRGKEIADVEVENALFKRATGYSYDEVTKELKTVVDEEKGPIMALVETKRVTKEVQADVTAQIFWLKNRKPKEWRDRQEHALTDGEGGPLQVLFSPKMTGQQTTE